MNYLKILVFVLGATLLLGGCETTSRYVPGQVYTDAQGRITHHTYGRMVEEGPDPTAVTTAAIFLGAGLSQMGHGSRGISGGTSPGSVSHPH